MPNTQESYVAMLPSDLTVVFPLSLLMSDERLRLYRWIKDRYEAFWPGITMVSYMDDSTPFNRARSRNKGLEMVTSEYVLMADADTAFDPGAIEAAVLLLEQGAPWVIPYGPQDYYNLTQEYTERLLDSTTDDPIVDPEWDHKLQSWAGLLICHTEDARSIGYDERFQGWGHEDVAFRIMMDAHIGHHSRYLGRALHLWHPRGEDEFNSSTELKNRALFDREYRRPYRWRDERLGK